MTHAPANAPHLIVPGWGGSGPEHWQTRWEHDLDATRIALGDWIDPRREAWVTALDNALDALAHHDPRPPVLVAHSLGCIAVVHWAQSSRWTRPIRAALLVAPADVEHAPCLPPLHGFAPVPHSPLPFPSVVVASDDDPYVTVDRAELFARTWDAGLHVIRAGGHLNASSGLGTWSEGRAVLAALLRRTALARTG